MMDSNKDLLKLKTYSTFSFTPLDMLSALLDSASCSELMDLLYHGLLGKH